MSTVCNYFCDLCNKQIDSIDIKGHFRSFEFSEFDEAYLDVCRTCVIRIWKDKKDGHYSR